MVLFIRVYFLLFRDFGDQTAVVLLGCFVEIVTLPAVFHDVESVIVEVLDAVEELTQLSAA